MCEAKAEAFAKPPEPATIRAEAEYDDGAVSAQVEDRLLTFDKSRPVWLHEIRILRPGPKPLALLGNGTIMTGRDLSGLGEATTTVGGHAISVDLSKAGRITVQPPLDLTSIACVVVARRAGRVVGRSTAQIYPEDRVSPCLETVRDGRFIRPARSKVPVTYLTFEGGVKPLGAPTPSLALRSGGFHVALMENGNYIQIDTTSRDVVSVQTTRRTNRSRGVVVETAPRSLTGTFVPDRWVFQFEAPGVGDLVAGDYPGAKGMDVTLESPSLKFEPPVDARGRVPEGYDWIGNQNGHNIGHFVVWEIQIENDHVTRLALDFTGRCEWFDGVKQVRPFYGMIRYNSTFH
jgi:hypothetical protein